VTPLIAALIFTAQGLAMVVDEFVFHRRRGLGRWESWGHPIDTLSVAAGFAVTCLLPVTPTLRTAFILLALFSCLLVTKDEWVHSRECTPGEQWLHACLFLLHPACWYAAFSLWVHDQAMPLRYGNLGLISAFALYQILAWNTSWLAPRRR
jgi:hypothetical protein